MTPQHLGFCFTRSRASGQLIRKDDTQPAPGCFGIGSGIARLQLFQVGRRRNSSSALKRAIASSQVDAAAAR
jgi:hypothetical protein